RQLQTMVEVSAEKNSTLIFPIPMEFMEMARGAIGAMKDQAAIDRGETLKLKDKVKEEA
ncbi:MAG: Slipin family protein, partial [Cyanobacteriota bacterium erpe_2018_sw_39hr_WHONDRS-SW48-000098_B_bin.30]|nr:Slipin family protein [Cyanobacteriota bacterium erpe_2018_sw_39hr_WHONDRS-SW48-000098_B_bin.30]